MVHTIKAVVSSRKSNKTITVTTNTKHKHSLYNKYISKRKRLQVHDENNLFKVGDLVHITNVKPISKTKSWTALFAFNSSYK
ncbi:30S ribosomal protein S17 [Candidatus Tremblaya phenacola]|uniref:30S ribosomal protein S17 n=1 Tax=Candidatus Tremblayella phenacoccinincola TaxID=1010676 RepID=A0A2G0V6W3_9PROT|nr:30S ribosomal protein S17 [Candidatus Tremblaya phenacola]PHN16207.1 30S ribosomal protein S17 [Candidatus Tremblaya phenacola]